jgi:hypothetical protein
MAKRFTATEIWEEDWFLDIPNEYKLFWYYMLSNCDHAGIYKVNLTTFSRLLEVKLSTKIALNHFNTGKNRITCINDTVWFIEDFFVYQYGVVFNHNNRLHASIYRIYNKYGIEPKNLRGLLEVKEGVKDKDKDKDKVDTGVLEEKGKFWFLRFYNSDYKNYKYVFNGQSSTEEVFLQWKSFIDFIYEKRFDELLETKFVNPKDFGDLLEKGFIKEKWESVLKLVLATGVKPEHNLFFRIPQFMDYGVKPTQTNNHPKSGEIYL